MQLTAVVIPVLSATSRSNPTTTSLSPSTIVPASISTPAPISTLAPISTPVPPTTLPESVATDQESTTAPAAKQLSSNGPLALPEKVTQFLSSIFSFTSPFVHFHTLNHT